MTTTTRLDRIKELLEKGNFPKFRFEQIKQAIFSPKFSRYSQITNLPKDLKERLVAELGDEILTVKKVREMIGLQAHKVLLETADNHRIEAVRLQYKTRNALCISTQSGCALGCLFCATGAIGFKKNLTADEILDQVLYFIKNDMPVDSIIFMGMGEPLANPDHTFAAIDQMVSQDGLALSPRRLSLSTVGIIPGIERLTRDYGNINLAFSLHNPFNDERAKLMPITNAYPIGPVMTAIDAHLKENNHKVFLAYILLSGVNDSERHAQALADLIKVSPNRLKLLHVNLIRYNPSELVERGADSQIGPGDSLTLYQKPSSTVVEKFQSILTQNKIHHTLRQDFGTDIKAACGQLAAADYTAKPNRK